MNSGSPGRTQSGSTEALLAASLCRGPAPLAHPHTCMTCAAKPPMEPSSTVMTTGCSLAIRRSISVSRGLQKRASTTVADTPAWGRRGTKARKGEVGFELRFGLDEPTRAWSGACKVTDAGMHECGPQQRTAHVAAEQSKSKPSLPPAGSRGPPAHLLQHLRGG